MLQKRRSFGARKVSPPQPTCMTDEQKASYLASLRSNRPARPIGSRPLPPKPYLSGTQGDDVLPRSESVLSPRPLDERIEERPKRQSMTHAVSMTNIKGRALVQAPTMAPTGRKVSPSQVSYRESAERQIEKKEAHSLRQALEKIDQQDQVDDEVRIYSAAQSEAAELVWRHRNPGLAEQEKTAAYRNPDLPLAKKKYVIMNEGSILDQEKGASIVSTSRLECEIKPLRLSKRRSRSDIDTETAPESLHSSRRRSSGNRHASSGSSKGIFRNPEDQIYEEPEEVDTASKEAVKDELPLRPRPRNSLPRGSRPLPGKPQTMPLLDQQRLNRYEIWKNPPTQTRNADYTVNNDARRSETPEQVDTPKGRALEIRGDDIRAATSMKKKDRSPKLPTPTAVSDRPGRPIVSFDPSWRRDQGSPRGSFDADRAMPRALPTSTASPRGSTDLGRPSPRPMPAIPALTVSAPAIPTINLPDDEPPVTAEPQGVVPLPRIAVSDDEVSQKVASAPEISAVPSICVSDEECLPFTSNAATPKVTADSTQVRSLPSIDVTGDSRSVRPLPSVDSNAFQKPLSRPLPQHTQSSPPKLPPTGPPRAAASRLPWLSRSGTNSTITGGRTATVTCTACALPVTGRIVTAAGAANNQLKARFHPECFTCYHCSTPLECVSFYPEPEAAQLKRKQETSNAGADAQDQPDDPMDLRFYCHLDFHELYSPKCASCHTPIEGAVILAVGKAWHEGHFFCAECGDPFTNSSPFVEHNNYAYCVNCHTKRTSSRCHSCKKQILDEISVEALGAKWHEDCFCCNECKGDFGEEGRFFVREVEVELTEKERRRGIGSKKTEKRAVCEGCEGRRLRAWDVDAFL